ncbi:MAG: 2Fe-2S iron-sulfur cluster-binding protein [Planctomycetota bacterium]
MGRIKLNDHADVPIAVGQDLLGAMLDANATVMYLCMSGSCGRCRVTITAGGDCLSDSTRSEDSHGCGPSERLACQTRLAREGVVELRQ